MKKHQIFLALDKGPNEYWYDAYFKGNLVTYKWNKPEDKKQHLDGNVLVVDGVQFYFPSGFAYMGAETQYNTYAREA
jgi:hypothetical protein